MAKASFHKMAIKRDDSVKPFEFNGETIEVKQYLPISDKYDLIMTALQKAEENGIYNNLLLNVYFALNIVYLYSNISFTENQKADELKLYDLLESNDLINRIIANIPEYEYEDLCKCLNSIKEDTLTYRNTAAAVLQSLIQDLPKNAQIAKDIVDSFDKDKYQEVVAFAEAANGGRNINTNQ